MTNKIEYIDVRMLTPHPDNPRKDLGDVTELADSIRKSGVLQNLTVVPVMDGDGFVREYRVVIGHRRLAAAKLAGLDEVPCSISDMDYKTQLATMLAENMQRADLTLVEQAEGIQMMLDLGESVAAVSEATGLSESTVRRRAKLAELPRAEFSAAVERGGRLEDYARIDELGDPEHRKEALAAIGTAEFGRKIESLLGDERWEARKAQIIGILDEYAYRAKLNELPSGRLYDTVYASYNNDMPPEKPPKPNSEYYYVVTNRDVTVYRLDPKQEPDPEVAARQEREAKVKERREALKVLTTQAYERRRNFVLGMSEAAASKHTERLIRGCAEEILSDACGDNYALAGILGFPDDWDESDIRPAIEAVDASRLLLMTWYTLSSDGDFQRYYTWDITKVESKENSELDHIYDVLIEMGYELTADEAALRDGSHELFKGEDAAEEVEK